MVPTTISDNAVAMRRKIDTSVASSASPSHRAAWAQISVMAAAPLKPGDGAVRKRKSGGTGWVGHVRCPRANHGQQNNAYAAHEGYA
ncbi:hypothetical protein Pssp01_21610 [Pseudomonas sp. NBRC 100443]|nr:hypothetical protein Pssp01_21610 [Pseudomonas sp. NBRC 100443]